MHTYMEVHHMAREKKDIIADNATTEKTAAKKTKAANALPLELQFQGGNYTAEEIVEKCKAAYRGGTKKQIRSIMVYVNAAQAKAYYVVNDNAADENGNAYYVDL